jgi:hypothetical protein
MQACWDTCGEAKGKGRHSQNPWRTCNVCGRCGASGDACMRTGRVLQVVAETGTQEYKCDSICVTPYV